MPLLPRFGLFRQGNRQSRARFLTLINSNLSIEVDDFGIAPNGVQKELSMAMRRIALHAQKRAWLLTSKGQHLRRLRHGFG
jgi:hypothetical protein